MSLFDTRITESIDERHVDLELLQLSFDGSRRPHWPHHVRVGKHLGQLVAGTPHVLYLMGRGIKDGGKSDTNIPNKTASSSRENGFLLKNQTFFL